MLILIGNLLNGIANVLNYCLDIYKWIIIARAVLSWVNPDPYNHVVIFIAKITDPVFNRIKKYIPVNFGGIDISPIIAFMIIVFIQMVLVNTLLDFARTLK